MQSNEFYVRIALEPGKRCMLMTGKVVTCHKHEYGGLYFKYSEYTGDTRNSCTESVAENGFAYHYDCGMNVLKEVKE